MALTKIEQKEKAHREHRAQVQRDYRLRKRLEKEQQKLRPARISSPQARPQKKELYTKEEVKELMLQFARENLPPQEPERLSRQERKLLKKKERLQAQLAQLEPSEEAKYRVTPEQASEIMKHETHFKGKKPLQFAKEKTEPKPEPARLTRRQRRQLKARMKAQEVFTSQIPEAQPPEEPDVVAEQVEKPQTTTHCPESIKEDGLREVRRNPEYYIEINMVTKSRVVDTFFIAAESKKFHYKTKEYHVDEEAIYLLPTKLGLFMPTCYYKEGTLEPRGFKQMNRGITGKALSLLYMEQLYTSLLYSEDVKYNFFIVILSIAILICYGVGCYFLFMHNGGLLPQPETPLPPIGIILGWWFA